MQQLQSSLESTSELLKKVMETATATEAEAAAAKEAMEKEVEAVKAKLAEAAGVLNAKEELREARCVGSKCRKCGIVMQHSFDAQTTLLCRPASLFPRQCEPAVRHSTGLLLRRAVENVLQLGALAAICCSA